MPTAIPKIGSRVALRIVTIVVAGLLWSCAESSFRGANKTATKPTVKPQGGEDANPKDPTRGEQEFELSQSAGKVDMVWLIDTSGSMREEAAHVQSNFSSFAATLSSRANTRIALIAASSGRGRIGVDFGSSSSITQHRIAVGSTNALAIAAAATCAAGTSSGGSSGSGIFGGESSASICGQNIGDVENGRAIGEAAGKLADFFREDAKSVFVIVTDDNARGVTSSNFTNLIANSRGGQTPTLYAFRGRQSRPNCEVARVGTDYESLASSTGGAVFDICDSDWSPNFASLGTAVAELANTSFVLDGDVTRIVRVTIDGRKLEPSDYTLSGSSLTINKGTVSAEAKTLKVVYDKAPE